jgi:hypothetical protein
MTTTRRILIASAVLFIAPALMAATVAVIPVVGATDGINGSHFATALQLHNPSGAAVTGKLVFVCPDTDLSEESIAYSLAAHETKLYADLLGEFHAKGIGSIDVQPLTGVAPVVVATIEGRAADASHGYVLEEQTIDIDDVVTAGTTTLLVAPDLTRARWNIGVRTFQRGAAITAIVHAADGSVVRTLEKAFGPNAFVQLPATSFGEGSIADGDSIELLVANGSAIIYGTTTDNTTQQPTLHLAQRIFYVHGSAGTAAEMIPTQNPAVMSTPWHGNAWIAGIGNVSMSAQQTVDFGAVPPRTTTTATFTDANGDQLHMSGDGVSLAPDAQGILNFEGLLNVTGGTGRFADATGMLHLDGGINVPPAPPIGFFALSGTLKTK